MPSFCCMIWYLQYLPSQTFSQFLHSLLQHQSRQACRNILPIRRCPQIIFFDLLPRNWTWIMEWNHPRIRPQHQLLHDLIRTSRVLRICLHIERNEFPNLFVAPPSCEVCMPEWEILQLEDSPDAVLFYVLIFVEATFPPLHEATGMGVCDALVGPCAHESSEASAGSGSVASDINYVLHLGMVEKEAVNWAISSIYKGFCESSDVEPVHPLLLSVSSPNELDECIWIVHIEINDLDPNQQEIFCDISEILTS
jgi:hypothetical protein